MNIPVEDKISTVKKQIRLCNRISILAVIVTVLLVACEYVTAQFFSQQAWASKLIRLCIYLLYGMPFVIVIPMFFKVNLHNRLHGLHMQEGHKSEKGSE